jgi:thiosulfate reductase/polysulfide reductase chain A
MAEQMTRGLINEIRGTETVPGVCMICSSHCPTETFVKNDSVEYVRGNEHAASSTSMCVKGLASVHSTRDADRLLYPMKRNSQGRHERVNWDQALTEIAERLKDIKRKYGPESLCGLWHLDSNEVFTRLLFGQLYGSPNLSGHGAAYDQDRRLAAIATFAHPLPTNDYANSRFVMLLGCDPFGSNGRLHENRELLDSMKDGCRLIVVDPNYSRTAEKAHLWLPIKPGTDGALALAMVHHIVETEAYDSDFCQQWVHGLDDFSRHVLDSGYTPQWAEEITGIPKETIIAVADEFATTKPAIMDGLKGLVNYSNGLDALRTIFALNVITGNIDGPGNLILKEKAPLHPPLDIPEDVMAEQKKPPIALSMGYPLAPDLPTQLLPKAVLEGDPYPVKALFFHSCNPAMSDPSTKLFEKMMAEVELSVTIDTYPSETAQLSEFILPEASTFERAEVREGMWSGPQVVISQPAIKPLGESKPLYDIMKALAEKMGYGEYFQWSSWEDWARKSTDSLPDSFDELKRKGVWEGKLRYHKFKDNGIQTPTGKFEVYSTTFESKGYHPLPVFNEEQRVKPDAEYPFQLINYRSQYHCGTHTQNNPYLMAIAGENWVELNPLDANRLGVFDGDRVEIASPQASATITAKVSEAVQPGVAKVPHGYGFGGRFGSTAKGEGTHINPLIDTRTNPVSGGISYNECKVKIRKI